ncbi:MAG: universal stress protein [Actinomycetota bacterium]|nr:universal stress protein [Actinomycetota bacterium]
MTYRKIVVGTDGSPTAAIALAEGAQLAGTTDAELIIVSSYESPDVRQLERWQSESPEELSWRFSGTALVEEVLERSRLQIAEGFEGLAIKTRFEEGEPAEVLISVAQDEEADLLVVGNKGMTGAKRFLLGSVPNRISHHSPCDVLIVRTTH